MLTKPRLRKKAMFSFEGTHPALKFFLTDEFSGAIIFAVRSQWAFDIYRWANPINIVGIDCREGPPVPIPNTEVKLTCADNTWRATAWEDR